MPLYVPQHPHIAKTGAYTVTNADKGATIGLSGGTFYTITLGAASGYDPNFSVTFINEENISSGGRAKWIAPDGITGQYCWPGETARVENSNNVWRIARTRVKLPSGTVTFRADFTNGSDTAGVSDGLGTGSGAFKSAERGFLLVADQFDLNAASQTVIEVVLADNTTDTTGMHAPMHALLGAQGGAAFKIKGGTNSIIHTTGVGAIDTYFGTVLQLQDLTLRSNVGGIGAHWGSKVYLNNVTFGGGGIVPASSHIAVDAGGQIEQAGAVNIAGSAAYCIINGGGEYRTVGNAFNFTADAGFTAFILASGPTRTTFGGSTINLNAHTITGTRVSASNGAAIYTGTGAASLTYFPGDVTPTLTSGASYDSLFRLGLSGDATATDTNVVTIAANAVTNSKMAQMAAKTLSGNSTASTANRDDLTVPQVQAMIGQVQGIVVQTGINFNSANTDTAFSFASLVPTGFTRVLVPNIRISGASASLTTATFGVFTASGGGGTALIASGTAITVSTASDGTNNNSQLTSATNPNTQSFVLASLATANTIYFRVVNPQGSAATGSVTMSVVFLP